MSYIEQETDRKKYKTRILLLEFLDGISIVFATFIGVWTRYDFSLRSVPIYYVNALYRFIPIIIISTYIVYYFTRLYKSLWRFASITEAYRIAIAYVILGVVYLLTMLIPSARLPISSLFITYLLALMFCFILRFGYRIIGFIDRKRTKAEVIQENVLIIGAGQAAREIITDINMGAHREYKICGIVDDATIKWGRYLDGICVFGGREMIPELVQNLQIERIIFAITNIDPKDRAEILNICKDTGAKLQMVPELYQLYSGHVSVSKLKDVELEDLLGRDEIRVNNAEIFESLSGKTVLVTGAGGSIGSELSRQIAASAPKKLILFDIYENTTYDIQMELERKYPELNLEVLIGDVSDRARVVNLFEKHKIDVIYHAAAHKHVPLMESSPNEAIKNNVFGTYTMAEQAALAGVSRFLLISTDKAVNPTNIMGASKRLCEMVIQMMSRKYPDTVFMAVRFGNVLGSNGSVIPLFKKQIAEGGPVTVTHKDIIRYFMTIPEAVSLVLQASHYAKGGEIFVLDMGKPVRIDDMARNLIRLSGYKPDIDIKIVYTGLRPGEKLYEELLMDEEGMTKTANELIYIGHPIEMNDDQFRKQLEELKEKAYANDDHIEELVMKIVPTYHKEVIKES
ncbi:MAG: polysaccharide biosynthesis protein [Solobacterium sp.]|nr:polysaccharide biosynthesis protein [Solobacterium sp.]